MTSLKYPNNCCVCHKDLPAGSQAELRNIAGSWIALCPEHAIPKSFARDGIRATMEAVLLFNSGDGDFDCELDHHDFDVLEELGLLQLAGPEK